ncbi:hypothetical protein GMOD_00002160 [Pyrenophora seminiperda CCB06]|uniref:Uncharacterized protein n=1 Tax=Pyrenophora seminiperda CCB06 TaxID=1302712 RepID=A0A3M7LXD0_9PLEO|nr:hypothetical protein GMOD_00002160 [Pyrenophora seminiperda CCB06]
MDHIITEYLWRWCLQDTSPPSRQCLLPLMQRAKSSCRIQPPCRIAPFSV